MPQDNRPRPDNEMRGVLFKNDKGGVESRPNLRGKVQIDSKVYKLAAWTKYDRLGEKYLSMAVTLAEDDEQPVTGVEDDIPG